MFTSQVVNVVGLFLDIVGFLILFYLAYPAVMRRDFVRSDRVGLDGVQPDDHLLVQLNDPEGAERRRRRRSRWQAVGYAIAGGAIVVGFALQIAATFIS